MKYIKLFEDNNWNLTPDKKEELLKNYSTILETVKSETTKFAINVTGISIVDIFKELEYYKKLVDKLEDRKAYCENQKIKSYDLIEKFYKEEIYSDLEDVAMNMDNISIELGYLKDLLEDMILFLRRNKKIMK
jgi:hypothetical protein